LGVGAKVPDNDLDMFGLKRKSNTSNDKLLEQLLGKKSAKGHQASKARAQKEGPQPGSRDVDGKDRPEPVVLSEDEEEEGRASMFGSKTKKRRKRQPDALPAEEVPMTTEQEEDRVEEHSIEATTLSEPESTEADAPQPMKRKAKSTRKGGSYMDQLLEEKARKKKKKSS